MNKQEETTWTNAEGFIISSNKSLLDIEVIHKFLSQESYWVKGIAKELVESSIQNSILCFGVYEENLINGSLKQVGFARVVSDFVRFSWLCDVFIIPQYRGRGLSKWLMYIVTTHPKLRGTSFQLATKDAHSLYAQYGFKPLEQIENRMNRPLDWDLVYNDYQLKRQ